MQAASSSPLSLPSSSLPATLLSDEKQTTHLSDDKQIKTAPTPHRPAQQLPFELRQHLQIYLEEALFTQALSFLTSLVSSSASSGYPLNPVLTPTPSHLAVVATLAIHPNLTSRTRAKEKWEQAHAALRLIRLINKVVGPVEARFSEAFTFTRYDHRLPRGGRHDNHSDSDGDDPDLQRRVSSPYAAAESVWSRAEDFWHIVGWTFNCACLEGMHVSRWENWSLWLKMMLEALEKDWQIRYHNNQCEESLLGQYVGIIDVRTAHYRRVMRAIWANGDPKSLNEFRPVFHSELKAAKSDEGKFHKRQVDVKVDEEIYGDYLIEDNSEFSSDNEPSATTTSTRPQRHRTPSSCRLTPRSSTSSIRSTLSIDDHASSTTSTTTGLGPPQSITLRLQLLQLLTHLSGAIPESFMELDELFVLLVEFIRPLPLNVLQQILSSSINGAWSPDAHTTLCEFMLQRMLESAATTATRLPKHPRRQDSQVPPSPTLTRTRFVTAYAPWAASKGDVISQAQVGLLVENLLRSLWIGGKLQESGPDLKQAVHLGIDRRSERARQNTKEIKGRTRKKGTGGGGHGLVVAEEEAWICLGESGERMTALLALITH